LPDCKEPEVWFHDVFRTDHSPYSEKEIEVIKRLNDAIVPAN